MSLRTCLFETAVYRVSEDYWFADVTEREERWGEKHGWHYNEVIAWVRLERPGSDVIKAYAWDVQQKRFGRGFTPFPFEGGVTSKLFEVWPDDKSSSELYHELHKSLRDLIAPNGVYADRYLDLEAFEAVGPSIDCAGRSRWLRFEIRLQIGRSRRSRACVVA